MPVETLVDKRQKRLKNLKKEIDGDGNTMKMNIEIKHELVGVDIIFPLKIEKIQMNLKNKNRLQTFLHLELIFKI